MKHERQSIGKEAALALVDKKWWEGKTPREIAEFQMLTNELCCPFDIFHEALEKALDRPVWTHEMGLNWDGLCEELFEEREKPSLQEIMDLIPAEKRIVIVCDSPPKK